VQANDWPPGQTTRIRPLKLGYRKTTLDNGLRVLTSTMPHTYSVGVGFYLSIGSRFEQANEAGAAHFIEHMLFKGTERRPTPEAIAVEIEGHGGLFNASTGQEMTVLWVKLPQPHMALAVDVLSDMVRNSRLQEDEIEKERRVILEEILSSQDIPEELVGLALNELTWPDHPLGWDIAGTPASVSAMSREALHGFLRNSYGPGNLVLSVAGDVDHDQVVEEAARALGSWQPSAPLQFEPAPDTDGDARVRVLPKKVEQSHLALHVPGLAREDDDRFALTLLNVILGEGMSSRLFLELRERLGLAYAVDSYTSMLADTGVVGIYAAVAPDKAHEALRAILAQLRRLCDEPVDDHVLASAKEFLEGRTLMGLEDTMSVAGWFGRQEVQGRPILSVEEVLERLAQVSVNDIQRVAQRIIRARGSQLAVVGPHKQSIARQFLAMLSDELP
jgi:predicted Zn-dependent peptidase